MTDKKTSELTVASDITGAVVPIVQAGVSKQASVDLWLHGSIGSVDNAVVRVNGTGGLTVQASNMVVDDSGNITTFGGRIKFPSTPNPSSDANTLDEYEEGTFTPSFSASGATFSYAIRSGEYTKIGNRWFVVIDMALNGSGNTLTANALTITGLPGAVGGLGISFPFFWSAVTSSYTVMMGLAASGGSSIAVNGNTAAAAGLSAANSNAALHATNGSRLRTGGFHYSE